MPVKPELRGKLLLPILGDQYGKVLERGELQLEFKDGALLLRYFQHELPVNPRQAPRVYRTGLRTLQESLGSGNPQLHEFLSILSSLENMPPYTDSQPDRVVERHREKEVARGRLAKLVEESSAIREHIQAAVRLFNGEAGRADSFDALHELLELQVYRLAYWRTASHEINYRRFFDINTLAGLRVEVPEVFDTTHTLLAELLREGRVTGVRVDHPDGLFDPGRYFESLQSLAMRVWTAPDTRRASTDEKTDEPLSSASESRPLYVVAEKILSAREQLPPRWAVHGTTGYNFLNDLNGIFVDGTQARRLRRVYARLTGQNEPFDDVLYASKRLIMTTGMASEMNVLSHMLDRIGESNRKSRDFTLDSMREVITEVVACFPVYRTYVDESGWSPADRTVVEQAIARARRRNPAMEASLFYFFGELVRPRFVGGYRRPAHRGGGYPPATAEEARERLSFSMKLQQYTGPVQAKGLEDTAFYRYNLLLSLNEVGGDPARIGRSVAEFHQANAERLERWPYEMIATATHDTKLGEDVRARVNAISEVPEQWAREVSKWMRINRTHRTLIDGEPAPDRNDEYRFYQALVGAWPLDLPADATAAPQEFIERLQAYMLKAVREAKLHTSWLTPNQEYENALATFITRVLSGAGGSRFVPAMLPFERRIAALGMVNSLAQLTLKLGAPGVPDFYQGTDLWDLSLVDPDNRRPVDFCLREGLLADVDAMLSADAADRPRQLTEWLNTWPDGRVKLAVTAAGLRLRRDHPALFQNGRYLALQTESSVPGNMVAFARSHEGMAAVFAAARLSATLTQDGGIAPIGADRWKTSRIRLPAEFAGRSFRDLVSGAELRPAVAGPDVWFFAGQIFETLPASILVTQ